MKVQVSPLIIFSFFSFFFSFPIKLPSSLKLFLFNESKILNLNVKQTKLKHKMGKLKQIIHDRNCVQCPLVFLEEGFVSTGHSGNSVVYQSPLQRDVFPPSKADPGCRLYHPHPMKHSCSLSLGSICLFSVTEAKTH